MFNSIQFMDTSIVSVSAAIKTRSIVGSCIFPKVFRGQKMICDFDLDNFKICGYSGRDLLAVAELMRERDIEPDMLRDSVNMYVKGYADGQRLVSTEIKKTMEGIKTTLKYGDFGGSMFAPKKPVND